MEYPYLALSPYDEQLHEEIEYTGNEDEHPSVILDDDTRIYGEDCAGEYNFFQLRPQLNALGDRLLLMVEMLINADIIDPPDDDKSEFIDVAPWHGRDL